MVAGKRHRRKPSAPSRQGETPPAAPRDTACAPASQEAQGFPDGRALDGPRPGRQLSRWDNVILEVLTYQDPDEAPFEEDGLSALDIVPHLVLPSGHFACVLSCNSDCFSGSLDAVQEHGRTCVEFLSFLLSYLWCDSSDPEEMALPKMTIFKVLHRPLFELQLARRDAIAAASCAGAVIMVWWKKLRRSPEEFSKTTTDDECLGNDAMGVHGERADAEGVLAGGGGFGNQVDQLELKPVLDVEDLLNASFFLDPGVSQVQSLSPDTDVGAFTDDSIMEAGDADTADPGDRAADEGMLVHVGGSEAVTEGFYADVSAPLPLLLDQNALGWRCRCPRRRQRTAWVWWSCCQRRRRLRWFPGGRLSIGSPTSLLFRSCRVSRRLASLV